MRTLAARASNAKELAIDGQNGPDCSTQDVPVRRSPDRYEKERQRADAAWRAELKIQEPASGEKRRYLPVSATPPTQTRHYQDSNVHARAAVTSTDARGVRVEDLAKKVTDLMDLGIDMS